MSFFKKLFKVFESPAPEEEKNTEERGQYLPEKILPVDELFTINFTQNGGKFLYCETNEELAETFVNILLENDWFEKKALTYESSLHHLLKENNVKYNEVNNPAFFFTTCESLIADDGAILFSDRQLKDNKANHLPYNIVVLAKTSQITRTKSDGLREIKRKYGSSLPSNITAFNCFKPSAVESDFLSYGRTPKNLYLILLEDL
ncbi:MULTISPECIES: LUD domain-containing protein [Myroides]|uniref:Lactate utilization protein B/C n=1 Tax=Myroides albus TaxID=2562892 RepID=A0A6I3LJL0_9FLAO|nr:MULTISPECIES: LUD domain-containing protein [Myroides]MTG97994.1 lactate utilization protein B/C [Myroides albus]MVX34857.1 lactate utilization protein B/C [Myroides sp. LoEW2-1]UVD80285.1 lactate utilization protein [Myroides albus]